MPIILLVGSITCLTEVMAATKKLDPGTCCLGGSTCNGCPFGGLANWVEPKVCSTLLQCASKRKKFSRVGICYSYEVPPHYNKCPVGSCCFAGSSCKHCEHEAGQVKDAGNLKGCAGNGNFQCLNEKKELTVSTREEVHALKGGDCCVGGSNEKGGCNLCPYTADPDPQACGSKGGMKCRSQRAKFHEEWNCLPHEVPPRFAICPVGNCCAVGSSCNTCEHGYGVYTKPTGKYVCDFVCKDKDGNVNPKVATYIKEEKEGKPERRMTSGPIVQKDMDYPTPGKNLAWAENVKSAEACGMLCEEWNDQWINKTSYDPPKPEHFNIKECPSDKFISNENRVKGRCCAMASGERLCKLDEKDSSGYCHSAQKNCEENCQGKWGQCGDPYWIEKLVDADSRPCMGYTFGADDLPYVDGLPDANRHRCWLKTKNTEVAIKKIGYTSGYPVHLPGKRERSDDLDMQQSIDLLF